MSRRNIILSVILLALAGIIVYEQFSVKKKVEQNIEKESVKLFTSFDKSSINSIDISNLQKGEKVSLVKNGDSWEVKDKNCKADPDSVERILTELPKIRLGRKLDEWKPEFMTKYGFDKGTEIQAGGIVFMLGEQKGIEIPLKKDNELYLSPFREKFIFSKYDGNWCEKVNPPAPSAEPVPTPATPTAPPKLLKENKAVKEGKKQQ
ncbi:MAG TPA: hypothetical protein PLZ43_02795 [bacterium]|nr:hypothetical protein [bacterium]